jgi:hypothetical protein
MRRRAVLTYEGWAPVRWSTPYQQDGIARVLICDIRVDVTHWEVRKQYTEADEDDLAVLYGFAPPSATVIEGMFEEVDIAALLLLGAPIEVVPDV